MFRRLQIGVWNSQMGLNLTESSRDSTQNVTDSMANRTLIVTTILVTNSDGIRAGARGPN